MRTLLLLFALATSLRASCVPPPNGYDWEAQRWQQSVITNSSTLNGVAYVAGTRYMQQAKWWGIRPLLGRVNLCVGANTTAWAVPVIRDWWTTADVLDTWSGVEGDYSQATGMTGNTSTGSKQMIMNGGNGLTVSTKTVATNVHMATYIRTASSEMSFTFGIQVVAVSAFNIAISYADVSYTQMGANQYNSADASGVGLYLINRRATTTSETYKNGALLSSDATSDTAAIPTLNMMFHCLNQGGTPILNTSRTLSYYAVGLAIAPALEKPYYDMVQNVQIACGRQK